MLGHGLDFHTRKGVGTQYSYEDCRPQMEEELISLAKRCFPGTYDLDSQPSLDTTSTPSNETLNETMNETRDEMVWSNTFHAISIKSYPTK